jgi:hypothetical protein
MTIVEITASSDPSEIAGTESAEATSATIQGKRADTRASRCGFQVDGVHRAGRVYQSLPRESCEERPVSASEVGKRERPGRQRPHEQRSTSKWIAVSV